MAYKEWFKDLDIKDDIDQVHSLYRTVKECSGEWGYEIKKRNNGFTVSKSGSVPHIFTRASKEKFCEYLDGLYDLGVEGEYERYRAMQKTGRT